MVTLYGGNDGLNTVVPAADPAYPSRARPSWRTRRRGPRPRRGARSQPGDDRPAPAVGVEQLAIVRGVGYPKPDRSHFRSMAIWQTARRSRRVDHRLAGPLAGRHHHRPAAGGVAGRPDPADAGRGEAGRRLAAGRRSPGCPRTALGRSLGPARPARRRRRDLAGPGRQVDRRSGRGAAHARSRPRSRTRTRTRRRATRTRQGASAGGQSELARQLDLVATLIEMGVPTRVYSVSLGGFDTHSDERGTQQRLLDPAGRGADRVPGAAGEAPTAGGRW